MIFVIKQAQFDSGLGNKSTWLGLGRKILGQVLEKITGLTFAFGFAQELNFALLPDSVCVFSPQLYLDLRPTANFVGLSTVWSSCMSI